MAKLGIRTIRNIRGNPRPREGCIDIVESGEADRVAGKNAVAIGKEIKDGKTSCLSRCVVGNRMEFPPWSTTAVAAINLFERIKCIRSADVGKCSRLPAAERNVITCNCIPRYEPTYSNVSFRKRE